jgi:hypothetical protein
LEQPGAHEERLESPEVIDARDEVRAPVFTYDSEPHEDHETETPVEIPFSRIPEPPVEQETREEAVPIRKIAPVRFAPPRASVEPTSKERRPSRVRREGAKKGGSSLITKAVLVALAAIVISVGIIGSGYGTQYVSNNPIIQFLAGTSTINK